ncbi:MAG: copper amine oxidase N-terminal domain-containing protein [Syntrophomonadaceae bacterium]|jgi:hypothetical protein|nr:copper amine oxidase N-terminal domain-containing protein [Syntrophomonadaceae bacterium]
MDTVIKMRATGAQSFTMLQEAWTAVDYIAPKEPAREIVFTIGSDRALIDGKEVKLNTRPKIEDGYTSLGARDIANAIGYAIFFDEANQKVILRRGS